MKSDDIRSKIIERLESGDITIKANGHHGIVEDVIPYKGSRFEQSWQFAMLLDDMQLSMLSLSQSAGRLERTLNEKTGVSKPSSTSQRVITEGQAVEDWMEGKETEPMRTTSMRQCHVCGENVSAQFNGKQFEFVPSLYTIVDCVGILPCKYAGGMPEYTVDINSPTGRLVFKNDMRGDILTEKEEYFEIGNDLGKRQLVEWSAERGFLTMFVGNTCPGVYLTENNDIIIGSEGHDDEDMVTDPLGKDIGSICTGLWWFYGCDAGVYFEAGGVESHIEADYQGKPGRYQMTVHKRQKEDYSTNTVYVTIKRIGDCV